MSGVSAKKSLGQNYLADRRYLAPILDAAELSAGDSVLEIGPGTGVLTDVLAERAGCLVAVELDRRLIEPLRQRFAGRPHVHIVHGDILEQAPAELVASACMDNGEIGDWRLGIGQSPDLRSPISSLLQSRCQPALLHHQRRLAPSAGGADSARPGRHHGAVGSCPAHLCRAGRYVAAGRERAILRRAAHRTARAGRRLPPAAQSRQRDPAPARAAATCRRGRAAPLFLRRRAPASARNASRSTTVWQLRCRSTRRRCSSG